MNNKLRGGLLLIIGILLAFLGIAAVYLLTRQSGLIGSFIAEPTQESIVASEAFVLTRDIKLGDIIRTEDLSSVSVPLNILPREPVTKPEEAVGKFVKNDLIQGEILLKHHLADPTNVNHDLAFILSEDHVLYAIAFDDVMTRENVIKRGDIVDILVTITQEVPAPVDTTGQTAPPAGTTTTPAEGTEEVVERQFTFDAFQKTNITALIMEVIESKSTTEDPEQPPQTEISAYLLALKPQDALVLKHLKDNGGIFDLAIRSPVSTQPYELTPVSQEYIIELYGLQILK